MSARRAATIHPRSSARSGSSRASPLLVTVVSLSLVVTACGWGSPNAPSASQEPSRSPSATPVPPTAVPGAETPAAPAARLLWSTVPAFGIKPHGGFEHGFASSASGALIQMRNLEGDATTIVATSPDGASWSVVERDSTTVPFGYAVNGVDAWMLLVPRTDGEAGTEAWASTEGTTWERRGQLPQGIGAIDEHAVNGDSVLVCGRGRDELELQAMCTLSPDAGRTWKVNDLGALAGASQIRGLVPLGGGFLALIHGLNEGEMRVAVSPDGSTWSMRTEPIPASGFGTAAIDSTVVTLAVAPEGGDQAVLVSTDGMAWDTVVLPPMAQPAWDLLAAGDAFAVLGVYLQPEGNAYVRDIVLSTDGRNWRTDTLPPLLVDRPDPEFMRIPVGLLVVGDPMMLVGVVVPA